MLGRVEFIAGTLGEIEELIIGLVLRGRLGFDAVPEGLHFIEQQYYYKAWSQS